MTAAGKHVAITGCTSGIGRAATLALARQGASLTLFYRNKDKGDHLQREVVEAGGTAPTMVAMDMTDLSSVRAAAQTVADSERPIDVLLNNAGVVNVSRRETVDGFEETLAVNHFAPFLLTGLLLPQLQQASAARVVNVASDAYKFIRNMRFDDMQAERSYRVFREYGRSKLANVLFTRNLAQRLRGTSVTANSLHPGAVATALGKQNDGIAGKIVPLLLQPFFLSPEQGAATSLYLCCSDDVANTSGQYFARSKPVALKGLATDATVADRLWAYTEESVDFTYGV